MSTARPQPARQDSTENIPDEPPPAYSQVVSTGDTSVQHGPSRPDFSGPPPMPERLENNITGVGVGYGPRSGSGVHHQSTGTSGFGGGGSGFGGGGHAGGGGGGGGPVSPTPTGGSNPFSDHAHLPPPPAKAGHESYASVAHDHSHSGGSSSAGPSRPSAPADLSPTQVPTPGRPLLHRGMMLVYPVGFHCHKCGNTGYKANDPNNPHETDWKKYGRKYNSALASSYASATGHNGNPNAQAASNFQRPLPSFTPPAHGYAPQQGFQPPPAKWNAYPGHNGQQGGFASPPAGLPMHVYAPPPGAVVLQAGDPRIGGQLCWRCGGSGRELSFFGFDDGKCWQCRGVGRVL